MGTDYFTEKKFNYTSRPRIEKYAVIPLQSADKQAEIVLLLEEKATEKEEKTEPNKNRLL